MTIWRSSREADVQTVKLMVATAHLLELLTNSLQTQALSIILVGNTTTHTHTHLDTQRPLTALAYDIARIPHFTKTAFQIIDSNN